jgi:hypothetical protein
MPNASRRSSPLTLSIVLSAGLASSCAPRTPDGTSRLHSQSRPAVTQLRTEGASPEGGALFHWRDRLRQDGGQAGPDPRVHMVRQAGLKRYVSFHGDTLARQAWVGRHIVLLVPQGPRSRSTMERIVGTLDRAYAYYATATGQEPEHWDPYTIDGRATIAAVPKTCGGGCGHVGKTGIEIIEPWVEELYETVNSANRYPTVPFYELGRNFWFYGSQLQYSDQSRIDVATGYAVLMRHMVMDALALSSTEDGTVRSGIERMVDLYAADAAWGWRRVTTSGRAPADVDGLGAAHELFASILMRLARQHGRDKFLQGFWREVGRRPPAKSMQEATDNFVLAASAGANSNLEVTFESKLRFMISPNARDEARRRFGTSR